MSASGTQQATLTESEFCEIRALIPIPRTVLVLPVLAHGKHSNVYWLNVVTHVIIATILLSRNSYHTRIHIAKRRHKEARSIIKGQTIKGRLNPGGRMPNGPWGTTRVHFIAVWGCRECHDQLGTQFLGPQTGLVWPLARLWSPCGGSVVTRGLTPSLR